MVWDDELHVPAASLLNPADALAWDGGEYRRPLVILSYALQGRLGGASAAGLHAFNALVHAANAALVVLVAAALGGSAMVALAAALLFAFHPIAGGSVAYISGRTDLLATLFTLAALLAATVPGRRAPLAGPRLAFVCVVVAAAALSKESGLMAGPLVAALLWWRAREQGAAAPVLAIGCVLAASAAAALMVMPQAAGTGVAAGLRLRGVGTALATFTGLLVWPGGLHLDRLTPLGGSASGAAGLAALASAAAILVGFARRPSRWRFLATALVLALLPGSSVVPVYPAIADRYVFTGEQFLYSPLVVIGAIAACGIAKAASSLLPAPRGAGAALENGQRGGRIAAAAALLLALAWTPAVVGRQHEFGSSEQVYRKTLEHSPSPRACFNLGNVFLARADYAGAAATYERCIAIAPSDAGAHGQLAIALQQLGRAGEARRAYERSTALDERSALVWSNFATLDANEGRIEDARAKWEKALSIDPGEKTALAALERLRAASR